MDDHDEGPGLFFSPWFWFIGAVSLCLWAAVAWVLLA